MISDIYSDYYLSPIGWIQILADANAIIALNFVNSPKKCFGNQITKNCILELELYFSKQLTTFTVPLSFQGTSFQQEVWKTLQAIPYGVTISYQELATLLHRPKAVRAVANAASKNPILILVPCHRVIGKNGTLTGYAAGITRKQYLLEIEKGHR